VQISYIFVPYLVAFAKLRKATISFVISVRLSVPLESASNNSALTGRIFIIFDTGEFFENMSRRIKVLLTHANNNEQIYIKT
jgi:hypothetical protein